MIMNGVQDKLIWYSISDSSLYISYDFYLWLRCEVERLTKAKARKASETADLLTAISLNVKLRPEAERFLALRLWVAFRPKEWFDNYLER